MKAMLADSTILRDLFGVDAVVAYCSPKKRLADVGAYHVRSGFPNSRKILYQEG
jgi:hypothetical protein